jgi:hypothetical protein
MNNAKIFGLMLQPYFDPVPSARINYHFMYAAAGDPTPNSAAGSATSPSGYYSFEVQ